MSTSCATAAPTRHPPGEAEAAPGALPLPATTKAAALAMNRAGDHVVGGVSDADSAFHFHPPRPLHAAAGSETPPTELSDRACRLTITRQATPQLHPHQRVQPGVAKNASSDTTRRATARLHGVGSLLPLAATNGVETPQWQKAPDTLNVTTLTKPSGCRSNQHAPCLPKTIGRHWQTRQSWQTWHAGIPCRRSAASSATKLASNTWPTWPSQKNRHFRSHPPSILHSRQSA